MRDDIVTRKELKERKENRERKKKGREEGGANREKGGKVYLITIANTTHCSPYTQQCPSQMADLLTIHNILQ